MKKETLGEQAIRVSTRFKEIDEVTGTFSSNVILSNYKRGIRGKKKNPLAKKVTH